MSSENIKNMITNDIKGKESFIIQRPSEQTISYLNVVNAHIRDDIFSQENYDKITKDPLFTKIVFALDDSIQRYSETYDYLKEFSQSIKEMVGTTSLLETAGFNKINKEFILKLYHYYLNKYKQGGLQSQTIQEKQGAKNVYLGGDMTRVLDKPITNDKKSLILTIILYAIMYEECSQKDNIGKGKKDYLLD
ncbi:hypothetical protein P148_SR1C00001G0414 [candidate division SR1 bacterium RAAC1_SR1_1]|nr:hypothetical protein P148_SR1C00001G0414 [candidate division SR1 bacterium RAAC1_SR1_1]